MAPEARALILAFGNWCDSHMDLVENDDWTYENLTDAFLMECGANGALAEDRPDAVGDASRGTSRAAASVDSAGELGGTEPDLIQATQAVLLLRDRLGREWTAGALVAPASCAGAAALPLASQEAQRLNLKLVTFKVVEE